jgi:hypothetical protein
MQPERCPDPPPPPPSQAEVSTDAQAFRDRCQPQNRPADLPAPSESCPTVQPCAAPNFALSVLPPQVLSLFDEEVNLLEASRSPQQGGAVAGEIYRRADDQEPSDKE